MRLWRAIVLMNLTLALGLFLGYLAWGREYLRLEEELARVRQDTSPSSVERTWTVRGIVRAVLPDSNMVVLTHEEMPGFMAPMTMGFRVRDPQLYRGLDIGDTVRFTVAGVPPNVVITAIAREGSP
jgi:Cu/Ag efflux protein CusF